eukprot:450585_1
MTVVQSYNYTLYSSFQTTPCVHTCIFNNFRTLLGLAVSIMSNTKLNIQKILDLPGNRKCADCASMVDQDTGWASLNLGVVMCIQCAGIHRAMGTHITKIRSFRLDTNAWTDKITSIFTKIGGNDRANHAVWEKNLPSFWINPKSDKGSETIRKQFIRTKYEKQAFLPPDQLRGRVNNCIKKMPIEVRQIECDFWCRGGRKYKTHQFAVIHSRWLSRYSGCKKSKASQQIDLTNFRIVIEENTTGFEDYDGYEFSLYEDTKYIADNRKEADMYNGQNEHKSATTEAFKIVPHDEPLLRCRIKDFKQFVNTVKDIRSTVSYYRVYDTLFEVEQDEPPLNITSDDIATGNTKMLGFGKIGWSKRYFCVMNGFLYQFKEDISQIDGVIPKALCAWDLQIVDCVLDENGKRSGSKYAVLIINGDKTISVKFNFGPNAVVFYSTLKQSWTDTRGKYFVDFSVTPPEISGEANGPQPIHDSIHQGYVKKRQKSSFFLPNPESGTLLPGKEQDALILNLIDEYVETQHKLKSESMQFELNAMPSFDISYTGDSDGYFEESTTLEISQDTDHFKSKPSNKLDIVHMEEKQQSIENDSSCYTEHELTPQVSRDQAHEAQELEHAMAIEQQMTMQNGYHNGYNAGSPEIKAFCLPMYTEEEEPGFAPQTLTPQTLTPKEEMTSQPKYEEEKEEPGFTPNETPNEEEETLEPGAIPNTESKTEQIVEEEAAPSFAIEIHNEEDKGLPLLVDQTSHDSQKSSSPLSPPMSHTEASHESENVAAVLRKESEQKQAHKAPPSPPIKRKRSPARAPALSTGKVANRVSIFNQVNDEIIRKKTTNSPATLSPDVPNKRRRKRRSRKRKVKKKAAAEAINIKMAHLQLTRWFNIDKRHVSKLSNPAFKNVVQQAVARWAILSILKDKRYVKIQISRRIPLPQREEHWKSTIEVLQNKLGGPNLVEIPQPS